METIEILEKMNKMFKTYGLSSGLLLSLNFLAFIFLFFFWKRRFENIADEISAKTIKSFETRLSLSISDLEMRKELLLYTGKKSIDIQQMLYNEIWALYFKYRSSWILLREKNISDLNNLLLDIEVSRNEIYKQSIYLGVELYSYFSDALSTMWQSLHQKIQICKGMRDNELDIIKSESAILDFLDKAREYLSDKLHSHQSIAQYDFSENEKTLLKRDREELYPQEEN